MIVPVIDMTKPHKGRGYSLLKDAEIIDSKIPPKGPKGLKALYSLVIPDLPRILATPRQSVKALSQALSRNTGLRNRHEVTLTLLGIIYPREDDWGIDRSNHFSKIWFIAIH